MPSVRATESGIGQTECLIVILDECGVKGLPFHPSCISQSFLENYALEGDSPVDQMQWIWQFPE